MKSFYIKMSDSIYYEDVDVDCSDIGGTNCYCDDVAMKEIETRLESVETDAIHFIDSGNYHYLSLVFLRRIKEEFALVVFDNHTDYQEVAFGGLTSCGAWIREAVETIPNLKHVFLIGAEKAAVAETDFDEKIICINKKSTDSGVFLYGDFINELIPEEQDGVSNYIEGLMDVYNLDVPIYVSIDKDVLIEEECTANWSQGEMTVSELTGILKSISKDGLLGVDVCGAPGDLDDTHGNELNKIVDEEIKKSILY